MRIQPLLAQLGVVVIAVGNGNRKWAKIYADTVPFVGEVLVDSKSQTHKTLKTKRWGLGVFRSFARSGVSKIYKKYGKGYKNYNHTGGSNENGLQTGAVLAVEAGDDGEVIYSFMEGNHQPTEFAEEHAILRAFGWVGDLPDLPEVQRNEDGTADATPAVVVSSPKARKMLGLEPLEPKSKAVPHLFLSKGPEEAKTEGARKLSFGAATEVGTSEAVETDVGASVVSLQKAAEVEEKKE